MTDQPDFESRLTAALLRRADAAPMEMDAYAVTRAAATARPSMGARLFGVPGWRTTRLVLAVVVLALLVAVSLVIGGRLVSPAPVLDLGRLVPAGEMTTARGGPTATLLKDGHVLLVGGQVLAGDQSSAELYDPRTDTFTRTGSISTMDRLSAAAAMLPDGRVLLVGGSGQLTADAGSSIAFPFAEIYDPTTRTFSRTGSMIQPRRWLSSTVTLPDGRVLIAGSEGDGGTYDSVELFDPSTDTFVDGGSLLVPRTQHTMTVLGDGRVLIAGGWSTDGPVATAEIYDPKTKASVPTGDLLEARSGHTASMLADGRVLIAGGRGPGSAYGEAMVSAELYDPETHTFAPTGSLTTERSGATALTLRDGRVLVAGGYNVDGDPLTIELYDPASGMFDVVGRLAPAPGSGNAGWLSATLLDDGSVLLAGRDSATVERYVPTMPAASADDPVAPSPVGFVAVDGPGELRTGHTATRLSDGRVLIVGGKLGGTGAPLSSAEIFDPATGRLGATGSMVAPRSGHVAALLPGGRVLIAGGLDQTDAAVSWPSAELYDPAAGTFSPAGTMTATPAPVRDDRADPYQAPTVATSLADGRVLILGWDPTSASSSSRSMQVYDASTGILTAVELPPGALVRGAQSVVPLPDGRVLVLDGNWEVLQAEVYDPVTGAWQLGAVTTGREAFASAVLPDGQVLLAGGKVGSLFANDESLAAAETWDPVSDTFSPTGNMIGGRTGGSGTLLPDGRVLISGGHDHRHGPDRTSLPNVYPPPELWDPVARSFGPAGAMVAQRSGHTATTLDDGRVLLAGGVTRLPDRDVADPPAAELYVGP